MSPRSKHSIDGFIPRRSSDQTHLNPIDGQHKPSKPDKEAEELALNSETKSAAPSLRRSDVSESLDSLGNDSLTDQDQSDKKAKKPQTRRRKLIKRGLIVLLVLSVLIGGFFAIRAWLAAGSIFQGNIFGLFETKPLKEDKNGRSNILVLGTSDDDQGHQGAYLTDSIMVVSVDQNNKNAYMISLPRDLQVQYGRACPAGYQGKLNAYYNCVGGAEGNIDKDRKALKATSKFIGDIVGLDIQYGVNVNYTVVRDLVKAVGGNITVKIESRDPRGQMDSNFDWKCKGGNEAASLETMQRNCPPNGHFIDFPNGNVKLDPERALYLAQARGDRAPTYGFEQSNFDREKNQQKIIKALREKAMSAGVLTDPGKVLGVLDALGNNLRTTFDSAEIRTVIKIASETDNKNIKSISLIDSTPPVLDETATPVAGEFNFTAIRSLIAKSLSKDPVVREGAVIDVYNGSGVAGAAQTEADKLSKDGMTIGSVANAPTGQYAPVELYMVQDKLATKAKLEKLLGVSAKTSAPPLQIAQGVDFVVIVGRPPTSGE